MLVTSRHQTYSHEHIINNNNTMDSHPLHHPLRHLRNDNNLNHQLSDHTTSPTPHCYSPRPGHRSKLPPHIQIYPPTQSSSSYRIPDEDLDNEVFLSSTPSRSPQPSHSPSYPVSDEKHEIFSGRLYIVRQSGSSSGTDPSCSPTSSPVGKSPRSSPSRASPTCRSSSPGTSRPLRSPGSSPSTSPSQKHRRNLPVVVRVYRCNLDHFAVISRDVAHSARPIYLNLRHCRVLPGGCLGRFILAGRCDSGDLIEFETPDLSTLGQWLDALQVSTPPASPGRGVNFSSGGGSSGNGVSTCTPPALPRSPALPTLTETDEED